MRHAASRITLLAGLVLCLGVLAAAAEDKAPVDSLGPAPSVEDLVALALQNAPEIAALEARLSAARERVGPAGAFPDPTLEVMVQNVGLSDWTVGEMDMSMVAPQLNQGIPFPGKRAARREAARGEVRVQQGEREALQRSVAREVRETHAALYALDRELETLDAGRELLDLLSATVAHHQGVGEADQEAVLKSRIARSRLEERARDLGAERIMQVASLNRLLDRRADTPLGRVVVLPRRPAPTAAWDSLAASGSADVNVGAASVAAAEARLQVARLDTRPDFMAGAGVGLRGDLDPVVLFRIGVELPIWAGSKQKPLIRAAEAEVEMLRHELRRTTAEAQAEAVSLLADYERTEEQITRYEDSLVPQSSLAFGAARSAYLAGRADFSTVIEDLNLWLEARAGLARRESDRAMVLARLEALVVPAPSSSSTQETRDESSRP